MRQENLNLFLGLFFDSEVFALVTEYCTRGSLEDLLNNEDVRLDWMFKSSLLMDLIRVRVMDSGPRGRILGAHIFFCSLWLPSPARLLISTSLLHLPPRV